MLPTLWELFSRRGGKADTRWLWDRSGRDLGYRAGGSRSDPGSEVRLGVRM